MLELYSKMQVREPSFSSCEHLNQDMLLNTEFWRKANFWIFLWIVLHSAVSTKIVYVPSNCWCTVAIKCFFSFYLLYLNSTYLFQGDLCFMIFKILLFCFLWLLRFIKNSCMWSLCVLHNQCEMFNEVSLATWIWKGYISVHLTCLLIPCIALGLGTIPIS